MKFFVSLLFLAGSLMGMSVNAATSCYEPREAEAEQGIRIHSELMVISLNCAHMADSKGNNLYVEYKKFTAKHEELLLTYEDILMENMRKNGEEKPEKSLHKLRTEFANDISKDAAEMRPDIFCNTYAERIEKIKDLENDALRQWAVRPFPNHPVSQPLCEG